MKILFLLLINLVVIRQRIYSEPVFTLVLELRRNVFPGVLLYVPVGIHV